MEAKEIRELKEGLNALGDKMTQEEKDVMLRGALAGDTLGERGINAEAAISPMARMDLTMEAMTMTMQDLGTEEEIIYAIIGLSKKVTNALRNSEKFDELKANYFEVGVDLEFYLNSQDKYADLALEEMKAAM